MGGQMLESTWDAVLMNPQGFERYYVCFAALPTSGSERVVLADESDWLPEDDAVPAPAAAEGMTDCLDGGQVCDIVENLRQQMSAPTVADLRGAIVHYWEYDAFIAVEGGHEDRRQA